MNSEQDRRERRNAWLTILIGPIPMLLMLVIVCMGLVPGLGAGHPIEYLQATCIAWVPFTLILPILRLLRVVSFPRWFDVLIYFDMYLYVYSLCCGLYLNISWWGDMTHVLSSMVVSCIVFMCMCLTWSRSPEHVSFGSCGGLPAACLLVSMSFGGIWEFIEASTDAIAGGPYMVYGAADTLGDLTADVIGAVIVSLMAYMLLGSRDAQEIVSDLRFGRESFRVDE